ncbi:MAG: bacterial extracellular solute-binding s, 3 family protein [Gammaproteobacteria bacterium]|jgi:ABC-type amino acid transport substrate-binding protein|nr:bacterial extracellular solute-binding s, 3 family protein [Gammaproteobacteria bacterium]
MINRAKTSPEPESVNLKTQHTLSVCFYSEFEPICYGNGKGFEPDLLRAIAKKWGLDIKFYPQKDYEGVWLLPSQKSSPCDVAIGGITSEQYRIEQGAVFSVSTAHFSQSLLVRKDDYDTGRICSMRSFKDSNMKIGVVGNTTGESYAHALAQDNGVSLSVFAAFETESELLPALKDKKIDAIARGEIGNNYQASLDKSLFTIVTKDFGEAFCIAVDPSNKALLVNLNKTIGEITHNGKIGYTQWQKNHNIFMEQVKGR